MRPQTEGGVEAPDTWQRRSWRVWAILLLLLVVLGLNGTRLLGRFWENIGQVTLARAFVASDRPAAARAEVFLRRAVAYSPEDSRAWRGLGFALLARGQDKEAMTAWQAVSREMADESILWGNKAQESGQIEEALMWYKRAMLLAPDWGMPWYNLGLLYEELEKWDDAIESFKKAEEYIDSIADISGSLYFRLGRRLKAHTEPPDSATLLRYYDAALASGNFVKDWERLDAHSHRGEILYRQGRVQEALQEFKWLVDTEPSYYWGHARLGRAIWEVSGDIDEAEKHLKHAIELRPKEKWAYLWLGRVYKEAGRQMDAANAYRQVLTTDPEDKTALQFFAAEHQGDLDQSQSQ